MRAYKAEGTSIKDIQRFVRDIKKIVEMEKSLYFPIVEFAENILPQIFPDYEFNVVSMKEMGDKHGETFPSLHKIMIREDVYAGAVADNGRDRMTIAHEVGHLFLHDNNSISLCSLKKGKKLKPYEDPEWHANCFGGELLASSYLIRDMSVDEVVKYCCVSKTAAEVQLKRANQLEI